MIQTETVPPLSARRAAAPPALRRPGLLGRLLGKPTALISGIFLLAVAVACVAAPWVAPYSSDATDFSATSAGPSAAHLLGTDNLGRDVLSRLLFGGVHTLSSSALAVVVALVLGLPVGMAAGYLGGAWDRVIGWISDGIMALPATIFLLAVLAVFPHNLYAAMLAFGILVAPGLAKVVRSVVLGVRQEQYIDVAKVSGIGDLGIMRRHIVSKLGGAVVVQLTLVMGVSILVESGLDFLGLGPQPPTPTWGTMVSDASQAIHTQPWLLIPTGGTIAVVVLALWFFGDSLRDAVMERWMAPTHRRRATARLSRTTPQLTAPGRRRLHAGDARGTVRRDAEAVFDVQEVTVAFERDGVIQPVVEEVSFSVRPGETVALLGESGCGKSVTARAAFGLLPAGLDVQHGRLRYDGTDYDLQSDTSRLPRGSGISVIFQEPVAALDPTLTVGRILVDSVRRHRGAGRAEAREIALGLLDDVGIHDPDQVLGRYAHELSGGMAQRVCIARALAGQPKVLIADEPTTALDVTVQAGVLELIRERQAETGLAVMLVTHDWGVVADIATQCVVMYAGQVVESATVEELFTSPRHPYTRGLLAANPAGGHPGERLTALPGRVPAPSEWPPGCRFQARCPFATEECAAAAIPLEADNGGRRVRCIRWKETVDVAS
ncbi:dipeptide/oligopeptide/nickel ABC transporter permease/ATP-binding protein [Sinomonas susongensis]|uniref:dipeptide/oligopeptide/nickel ABC transporter permease/ATP-binding protein n=1 Tax=Sinomonas susongensis TaxID=1324851 RepID=UPI001109C6FF|nr:dipeptide/oligopeptide/nickel ABC transporter permease/ATP-binding protein [Sinomonas susongensis]